jgi:A/G-specific adenine glycosylase
MPGEAPGELAQALIELGALVCKRNPACGECPVRARCAAKEAGRASAIPPARARRAPTRVALTALVLADAEGVVLTLRPDDGLFGGMWCPPLVEGHPAPAKAAELAGLPGLRLEPSGDVRHLLTHRALETRVLAGAAPRELPAGLRKVAFERLDERGLPSFATKLLRAGAPLEHLPERLPGRDRERPSQLPLFEGGRRE